MLAYKEHLNSSNLNHKELSTSKSNHKYQRYSPKLELKSSQKQLRLKSIDRVREHKKTNIQISCTESRLTNLPNTDPIQIKNISKIKNDLFKSLEYQFRQNANQEEPRKNGDDISIFMKCLQEFLADLEKVFEKLKKGMEKQVKNMKDLNLVKDFVNDTVNSQLNKLGLEIVDQPILKTKTSIALEKDEPNQFNKILAFKKNFTEAAETQTYGKIVKRNPVDLHLSELCEDSIIQNLKVKSIGGTLRSNDSLPSQIKKQYVKKQSLECDLSSIDVKSNYSKQSGKSGDKINAIFKNLKNILHNDIADTASTNR